MTNLTYSADDLRQLAKVALTNGDFEGAIALADNAKDTEVTDNEQKQGQESSGKGSTAD